MLRILFTLLRSQAAVACVLICIAASAPAQAGAPRSLRFEHLGLEQGLAQETVKTILQDRAGFMWFGTQGGLNRYDGYKMRVYRSDPGDPASLPDNYVQASYEDGDGRLWFGTRGGLARFDEAGQKFVPIPSCPAASAWRATARLPPSSAMAPAACGSAPATA